MRLAETKPRISKRTYVSKYVFAVFIGVLVVGFGAFGWLTGGNLTGSAMSVLEVDPETLDFGKVWARDDFRWEILVVNNDKAPVIVTDVKTSCECTSISPLSFSIEPGGQQRIQLRLDLTSQRTNDEEVGPRKFTVAMFPKIENPKMPSTIWKVGGVVVDAIAVEPFLVLPDEPVIQGRTADYLKAKVTSYAGISGLELAHDEKKFSAEVQPAKSGSPPEFSLRIRPSGEVALGKHRELLSLIAITSRGEKLPAAKLPVEWLVVGDAYAIPHQLILGVRDQGEEVEETIKIFSRENSEYELLNVKTEDNDISFTRVNPTRLGEIEIKLKAKIEQAGVANSMIIVDLLQISTHKETSVRIPIKYYGRNINDKNKIITK